MRKLEVRRVAVIAFIAVGAVVSAGALGALAGCASNSAKPPAGAMAAGASDATEPPAGAATASGSAGPTPAATAGGSAAAATAAAAPTGAASGATGDAKAASAPAAERQFTTWLAAFNAGDMDAVAAFQKAYFTPDLQTKVPNADQLRGFRQNTGGFDIKKAEESSATRYVAIVKERNSDRVARITLEAAADEPHAISSLELRLIATPDEMRPARMTEAEALAALRAEIDKAVAADQFAGTVVVARHGAPIFTGAYGMADREKKIANRIDTRFRIGSMNKMFTATAIVQLIQAGKLAPTDALAKLLPDYPNKQLASKVTVHHLLTHTGGTGDIFGPEFDAHRLELRTLQDYVKLYGARDLGYEPGARWQYSNYGFLLLGAVIERVTHQSYYDWVARRVFAPAGMTATASPVEGRSDPARCVAYTRETPDKPWASAADTLPYRATSAGGGDSTVIDLLHFANALTSHKLLDAEHTALLTSGKVDTGGSERYAYGFFDGTAGGVRCFGHGGGAPGMNGQLTICDSGYTVAVLANLDPPIATRIADFIVARLPAEAPAKR